MEYKNLFKELEVIENSFENTHISLETFKRLKNEIISYYQESYRNEKEATND